MTLCSLWYLGEVDEGLLKRAFAQIGYTDASRLDHIIRGEDGLKNTINALVAFFDRYGGINTT